MGILVLFPCIPGPDFGHFWPFFGHFWPFLAEKCGFWPISYCFPRETVRNRPKNRQKGVEKWSMSGAGMHGIRTKIRRMSQISFGEGKMDAGEDGTEGTPGAQRASFLYQILHSCVCLFIATFNVIYCKKNPITRKIDFRSCHSVRFLGKNGPNNQNPEDLPRF